MDGKHLLKASGSYQPAKTWKATDPEKGTHRTEPNITFPSRNWTIHKPGLKAEKLSRENFRWSHGTEENTGSLRPKVHGKHPGLTRGFLMDCIPRWGLSGTSQAFMNTDAQLRMSLALQRINLFHLTANRKTVKPSLEKEKHHMQPHRISLVFCKQCPAFERKLPSMERDMTHEWKTWGKKSRW